MLQLVLCAFATGAPPLGPRVAPQLMHTNPHASSVSEPHQFTWEVPQGFQHSYRLQILSSQQGNDVVVDTGRVTTTESHRVAALDSTLIAVTKPLQPGRQYFWRIKVWTFPSTVSLLAAETAAAAAAAADESAESAWSLQAKLTTTLWNGFANSSTPIWLPANANFAADSVDNKPPTNPGTYALFRKAVAVTPSAIKAVTVYVTAATTNKLLGAYRLTLNGNVVGIGPGRGECRVGQALGWNGGCTLYDVIDVTDAVKDAGGGELVFGLQSYYDGDGAVLLEAHLQTSDGKETIVATDTTWEAYDATAYFNPFEWEGAYNAPRENMVAALYPGPWQQANYTPATPWKSAAAKPISTIGSVGLVAKLTKPIEIKTGIEAAAVITIPSTSNASVPTFFYDFGSEIMAGIHITVPAGQIKTKYAVLTMSEELVGAYGEGTLLYPMRTGNHYRFALAVNPAGPSVFELHEYCLFRYATVQLCDNIDSDGGCAGISPPPPSPPSPHPSPPGSNKWKGCGSVSTANDKNDGRVTMACAKQGEQISAIEFANYGTATGSCSADGTSNTFVAGKCSASNAMTIFEKLCVGQESCSFVPGNEMFQGCTGCQPDGDPCHYVDKVLDLAVTCKPASPSASSPSAAVPAAAAAADGSGAPPFQLSAWRVRYPWNEAESAVFDSSNSMLNKVWELCKNTLRVTSLDTTTDSNTRERLPYEADGYITGSSRYIFQADTDWQLHSGRQNFLNPTWPTEWHQFMPLIAYDHYMQSGDTTLAEEFWELLKLCTYTQCADNANSGLVNFTNCSRQSEYWPTTKDIVDWPQDTRDGYQMTDVNTVINAFMVGSARKLASLGRVLAGQRLDGGSAAADTDYAKDAAALSAQADTTAAAMQKLLFNDTTQLFVDGFSYNSGTAAPLTHSAWHAQTNSLWFKLVPDAQQSKMVQFLSNKGMVGSVYGAFGVLMGAYGATTDHGHLALQLMTSCVESSWCHMLNVNATATMEAWSRAQKPNLSWSHPWASAPATAIARGLMGITATKPAYAGWQVMPQPGNLTWGSITMPTKKGSFGTSFNATDTRFTVVVSPPGNTEGTICVPKLGSAPSSSVAVNGKTTAARVQGEYLCVDNIAAGTTPTTVTSVAATVQ